MNPLIAGRVSVAVLAAVVLMGCKSHPTTVPAAAVAVALVSPSQSATTQPALAGVHGTVTFTQLTSGVRVDTLVFGLPANSQHGFHLHEKGDLSAPDLSSAGGHWDPAGHKKHGSPDSGSVHAGDLGNLRSDANGIARLTVTTTAFSITGEPSVVGKSVIIHASPDDLASQPAGNSGARIAGGVVNRK